MLQRLTKVVIFESAYHLNYTIVWTKNPPTTDKEKSRITLLCEDKYYPLQ